jgi:hypothetical protein
VIINPHNDDQKITINDVIIEYVANDKFIKYLGGQWSQQKLAK